MTFDEVAKFVGLVGGGTLVVGLAGVLKELILGKRKANTEDKNVVISGAEKVVIASTEVIEQIREQMAELRQETGRLHDLHMKCQKENEELRHVNKTLTERLVALEKFKSRMEREGRA